VVQVPGAVSTTTAVVGMTPSRGAGLAPNPFTFNFSDTKGYADLGVINILINNSIDGRHGCYLAYARGAGALYLVDDAGNAEGPFAGSGALNVAGSVQNSQCVVSWGTTAVNANGNNLALTLNIAFTSVFNGNRVFYLAARDAGDGNNTGWQAMGTWGVQPAP
jgi:trimeric autotransporter adhesin